MTKRDVKRRAAAAIIHVGCNSIDSLRVMAFSAVLRDFTDELSDKEKNYIAQRSRQFHKVIDDMRRLAWKLEGQDKTSWGNDSTVARRHATTPTPDEA